MSDVMKTGVIPAGGFIVENIAGQKLPASITLTDIAGTRNIQISFDGTNYYTPAVTVTDAAFITLLLTGPARLVKITGTAGATYNIQSGS